MKQPLTARSSARLSGRMRVPGDKSISHRALILGALATGTTRITGLLEAEDVAATANALSALGAEVERSNGKVTVRGQGIGGLRAPSAPLDFGNSGTGEPAHARRHRRPRHASRADGRCLVAAAADGPRARAACRHGPCKPTRKPDRATLPLVVRGTSRPPPHRLRPSRAVGASEVGRAARRSSRAGPHHGDRALGDARPHRAHAGIFRRRARRRGAGRGRPRGHGVRRRRTSRREHRRAGRSEFRRVPDRRGADCSRLRHCRRGRAAQSDAKRLHRDSARDGREHRDARPPRRRRRACRRSSRAIERAERRARAAAIARRR